MKITGEKRIQASRSTIWAALLSPEVLRDCVPGCENITARGQMEFDAVATVQVGPIKARFSGSIDLLDAVEPEACRIVGKGSGGVAGFAQGEALVHLIEETDVTILKYDADIRIGGKISSLGDRLFRSIAEKNIESFFGKFSRLFIEEIR